VALLPVATADVPLFTVHFTVAQESATRVPSVTKTAVKQFVVAPAFMRVVVWACTKFPNKNVNAKAKKCSVFFMSSFSITKLDDYCVIFVVLIFQICGTFFK
jgi:hypothetical protein